MKGIPSKGTVLLILVVILTGLFSFRQLSDSDIGTHLKAGKWIVENNKIPDKDTFTYTSNDHEYLDAHWLFQVLSYNVFKLSGYKGLSIFVFLLSMALIYLIIVRLKNAGVSPFIVSLIFLAGFLCIENRITLRPEMFSFLFLTGMLLALDRYYRDKRMKLQILPLIMLVWCNMHGLFILGFFVMGTYFLSISIRDRKADRHLLLWIGISFFTCFANPYSYKILAYPFLLLTRLNAENIFHQHVREFTSFSQLDHYFFKDYLFLVFSALAFVFLIITRKKRKIHEFILLPVFFYLAWMSIRNIALFALVTIPIFCFAAGDLWKRIEPVVIRRNGDKGFRVASIIVFILAGISIAGLGLRVYTNAYYNDNHSYTKTGMGLDNHHLPMKAVAFLNEHHLDGRIINSLSPGGWLSWGLPQPVFIDGRLEMMGEDLYKEVIQSWSGGLGNLIEKYQPSLIIYNYAQYYPWTAQLATMKSWRPIYLDGYIVVFAKEGYSLQGSRYTVQGSRDTGHGARYTVQGSFPAWLAGFWKGPDYEAQDEIKVAKFWDQMNRAKLISENPDAIQAFNEGNQKYSSGDISGAMASYTKAIELNPSYYKAYNNLGILKASALKNFPDAIADFTKAIEIDPGLPDAWLSRGTCWLGLKQLDKACPDWHKAQSLGNQQATKMLERYCR